MPILSIASQVNMFHVKHTLELLAYSELFCNTIAHYFSIFTGSLCVFIFRCVHPYNVG